MKQINIEGYTADEIPSLPDEQLDALVLSGEPLVFRAGSAEILGEFRIQGENLIVELAQIDGGGEGVLPTLASLAQKYARRRGLKRVEWIIHALNCAEPKVCEPCERGNCRQSRAMHDVALRHLRRIGKSIARNQSPRSIG